MPEHETMRLSSITLQANSKNQLVGVQCKLSNGLESRLFKSVMAENDDKLTTHTCDFTEEMEIKQIQGKHDYLSQVFGLTFKNPSGEDLLKFVPGGDDGASASTSSARWDSR